MKIKLELSLEEIQLLISGLAELPAKLSFNLLNKIYQEVEKQKKDIEQIKE